MIVTSGRRRLSPGMAVMMVSLIGVQGAFMGAVISFAQHPLYTAYAGNSLNDQALAGVMMCVPASLIYVASSIWALTRMLRAKPVRSQRARNPRTENSLSNA
jgi:putative membrane protein